MWDEDACDAADAAIDDMKERRLEEDALRLEHDAGLHAARPRDRCPRCEIWLEDDQ